MIDLGLSWLWAALAGAVGLLAVWFGGRRSAKTAAKLDAAKETIKAHEERNEVEADVAADPDPRKRLRSDWSR
jgi:hypothetical protein